MAEIDRALLTIFRKQLIGLVLLALTTVPLFLFTRSMAAHNRERNESAARVWFSLAEQQLKAGEAETAIDSLRNATTNDHSNAKYAMTLATALASVGHIDEARQSLLRLRETNPEAGEINLDLARLAAAQSEIQDAIRYYHSALYGVWPPEQSDERRRTVRFELIQFLLDQRNPSAATSELLILDSDLPHGAPSDIHIGELFLGVNEPLRALSRFSEALKAAPKNPEAIAGYGEAEFQLGDYVKAQHYLQAALSNGSRSETARRFLNEADLIVANDPLAVRLGSNERQRRISVIFHNAADRLSACLSRQPAPPPEPLATLKGEVTAMESELQATKVKGDLDMIRSALNLAYRLEVSIPPSCAARGDFDEALLAIARSHRVAEQ